VPKDYVYAHMWGNLAAANGNELGGEVRDYVAKIMTPADISEAQKLARSMCLARITNGGSLTGSYGSGCCGSGC
jgi:hypothetical protein